MPQTFTRQELYELVWAEPMKTLSKRFAISDVGMTKACKKASVPTPPRGYWARLAANKKVQRLPLPPRGPGMSDTVEIAPGRNRYYHHHTDQEILATDPQPPVFEDAIENVAARVKAMVRHFAVPTALAKPHRLIQRYLEEDEGRRRKLMESVYSWEKPLFDDPFEKRRFRILNAVMTALERYGMRPGIQGREARNLYVSINDTSVAYRLDATSQKYEPHREPTVANRGSSNKLRLQILTWGSASNVRASWEDSEDKKLEKHLDEIVVSLIVAGERQYRESRQRYYEWLLERKTRLLEEARKRKEEAERKERERIARLEQARIDRLMADAAALRQAADIRTYVAAVQARCAEEGFSDGAIDLEVWTKWALAQADRIDPVRSRRFAKSMNDQEDGG